MIKSRDDVLRNIRRGVAADIERSRDWYPCRHFPNGECHHPECRPDEPRATAKPMPVREPPIDLVQLKAQVNYLQNKLMENRVERVVPPAAQPRYKIQ